MAGWYWHFSGQGPHFCKLIGWQSTVCIALCGPHTSITLVNRSSSTDWPVHLPARSSSRPADIAVYDVAAGQAVDVFEGHAAPLAHLVSAPNLWGAEKGATLLLSSCRNEVCVKSHEQALVWKMETQASVCGCLRHVLMRPGCGIGALHAVV